jgi:hypothetical protein
MPAVGADERSEPVAKWHGHEALGRRPTPAAPLAAAPLLVEVSVCRHCRWHSRREDRHRLAGVSARRECLPRWVDWTNDRSKFARRQAHVARDAAGTASGRTAAASGRAARRRAARTRRASSVRRATPCSWPTTRWTACSTSSPSSVCSTGVARTRRTRAAWQQPRRDRRHCRRDGGVARRCGRGPSQRRPSGRCRRRAMFVIADARYPGGRQGATKSDAARRWRLTLLS